MCDYSLEAYRSRPARQGEHYTTHRFPSGTIGFITPGDSVTAICMAYDTKLTLEDIPQTVQHALGVQAREPVIFSRLEHGLFQDGVRFERVCGGASSSTRRAVSAPVNTTRACSSIPKV